MDGTARHHHGQKNLIFVLLALVVTFAAMIAVGMAVDSDWLTILGFCGAMPTLFAFLVNLIMYLSWSE